MVYRDPVPIVVTFEQAVSVALEMAREQQRPYYVIERATGWALTTYKPKRGRSVIVEPPRPNLLDTEKLRGAFAPAPLNVRAVLSRPRRRLCKEGAMENAQPPTRST